MKHNILIIISLALIFLWTNSNGQENMQLLQSVLTNNLEYKQMKSNAEYQSLQGFIDLAPKGVEIEAGYFPGRASVVKNTFSVTQRFDFPTVYKKKLTVARTNEHLQNLNLKQYKMNLLVQVQQTAIEYVYSRRKLDTLKMRLNDAENLLSAFVRKQEQGEANLLEVNKIKLQLTTIREAFGRTQRDLQTLSYQLTQLNGGESVDLNVITYPKEMLFDSAEYLAKFKGVDPKLQFYKTQEEYMQNKLNLTKHQNLPGFLIGYGYEDTGDEKFSGVRFGLNIPLWQNVKKRETAQVGVLSSNQNTAAVILILENQIEQDMAAFKQLKESVNIYQTTMRELKSVSLLKKSLGLGHISLIQYLMELSYFYTATDKLMELEKEKAHAIAVLSKYDFLELAE